MRLKGNKSPKLQRIFSIFKMSLKNADNVSVTMYCNKIKIVKKYDFFQNYA